MVKKYPLVRYLILSFLFAFLITSTKVKGQAINDYISIASGSWSSATTWGVVTGTGPLTWSTASFAPSAGNNVYVRTGNTVTLSGGGPFFCTNLNVQSGGKLYTNSTGANVYITLTGNIVCDGQIGNFPTFDAISFNIDGASCAITGTGTFDSSRMRKSSTTPSTTNLTVDMYINLWFPTNTTTQLYNNAANTNFNVTVGVNGVLNLLSSGGFTGHASIDGLDGGAVSSNTTEAGGTWTINGTMIISGKLFLGTNNANTGFKCNWIVNGLVSANEIVAGASGLGGSTMTVNAGGKLELTGTPAWSSLSATNNVFGFASGSTVEYSASGNQTVRVASEFGGTTAQYQYGNLVCSFSGSKTCLIPSLYVKNDLRISGSAVLIPTASSNVFVGGNWYNWGSAGYTEGLTVVLFNNTASIGQSINCPGGEIYANLTQNSPNNILTFNCMVTVNNTLRLNSAGGHIDLNSNQLLINNGISSSILGGGINRYIISEKTTNLSKVTWRIGTSTGTFLIPFGVPPTATTNYFPVTIVKNFATNLGDISIATYGTGTNNQPWPTTPTLVTNLWADNAIYNTPDNRGYCVDRFWQINATGTATVDSLKFGYRSVELPDLDPTPANMRAQRWVSGIQFWDRVQFGVAYVNATPVYNVVSVPQFNIYNTAWTLSSLISPLPIELLSFTGKAKKDVVQLNWSTATEINNDYFTLERSKDSKTFFPIATIRGAGNSSVTKEYEYIDEQPFSGVSYYRLKQTDFDGRFSYSQTVIVNMGEGKNKIAAFPNPATDIVYLTGTLKDAHVKIYSLQGVLLKDQQFTENTSGLYDMNVGDIPPGVYIIEILNETNQQTIRLVKE